jgi:hypothetical protein
MLWAGILFIWELVGIDLEKARDAGGNFGAIIGALKSPQAVPWALLILVGYFVFKVTVEWHQCNLARRKLRVARIDYASACIIGVLAYVLHFGQAASSIQFADILEGSSGSIIFGFAVGALWGFGVSVFLSYGLRGWTEIVALLASPVLLLGGLLVSRLTPWHAHWKTAFVLMLVGFVVQSFGLAISSERLRIAWKGLFGRLRTSEK